MQLDLSKKQLNILVGLVDSRIKEICPESKRSRLDTVHEELKDNLNTLQDLLSLLETAQKSKQAEQWEGYAETRDVPSNPPPAG